MRRTGVLLLAASAASCAARQPSPPPPSHAPAKATSARATSPIVEEGASLEAAVIVPSMSERDGIAWENDWIYDHYGRFRKRSVALASQEGRRYDVIWSGF
jgi:hypothetical protein